MRPIGFLQKTVAGGGSDATLVGTSVVGSSTNFPTMAYPSGTTVGDLVVLQTFYNGVITITGWTRIADMQNTGGGSVHTDILWKVMTSGDISTPPTIPMASGWGYTITTLRSCTSAALVDSSVIGTTSLTTSGFTKNVSSKGFLGLWSAGFNSSGRSGPAGWTIQLDRTGTNAFRVCTLASASYTNGTTSGITWTGPDTNATLAIVEFT